MLEHTKKPPIDKVVLQIEGPESKKNELIVALKALGFNISRHSETVSWREAFPEFTDNEPGVSLAGARYKKGITQIELSKNSGIPRRHISEMENGKRPIGKNSAKKFAKALEVDYRVFL